MIRVKGLSWVGIGTDRYDETFRFFTEVFDLSVVEQADRQAILRVADGQQLEIFGRDGPGKSLNSPPTIAFEVEDVAGAREALVRGGAELIGDISSWNGHEWLYFRSPDGHIFEIKKTPPD